MADYAFGSIRPTSCPFDASEPEGQELLYSARVSLDQTRMPIEDTTA
jgi:hypothetical protein